MVFLIDFTAKFQTLDLLPGAHLHHIPEMIWRPIHERIALLRGLLKKLERTPGASPRDLADLRRIMSKRITELEGSKVDPKPESASRHDRRAA